MTERRLLENIAEALMTMSEAPQPQPQQTSQNVILKETLDSVMHMLQREDRGWQLFSGNPEQAAEGLTLDNLKTWGKKLREWRVGSPRGRRGFSLRHGFVHKGGIQYSGIPEETRGRGPKVNDKINDLRNQRALFGHAAINRCEARLYTDGIALWIGDDATKILEAVPIEQITGYLPHYDYPGIIMAYRREWTHRDKSGKTEPMLRWYFTDEWKDEATATITTTGAPGADPKPEKVEKGFTAFDMHANTTEGWPFGVPDALAAWIWDQIAKELFLDGVDVSNAMASLAFKVTTTSKTAQTAAGVQFANPQAAASTHVMGVGTDVSFMQNAGRGYDFSGIREIVSHVAAALDVSNIHLTANPGDAGSSYGSASSLDEPGRLTMTARRMDHIELHERVLHWMGAKDAEAFFNPYEDGTEILRQLEAITLPWLQGIMDDTEYKALVARALGLPKMGAIPDGVLLPNNKDSQLRPDVDDPAPAAPTKTTPTPSQGKNKGVTGTKKQDKRDDTVS